MIFALLPFGIAASRTKILLGLRRKSAAIVSWSPGLCGACHAGQDAVGCA